MSAKSTCGSSFAWAVMIATLIMAYFAYRGALCTTATGAQVLISEDGECASCALLSLPNCPYRCSDAALITACPDLRRKSETNGNVAWGFFINTIIIASIHIIVVILAIIVMISRNVGVLYVILFLAIVSLLGQLSSIIMSIVSWGHMIATYNDVLCTGGITLKQLGCDRETQPILLNVFAGILIIVAMIVGCCTREEQRG